MADLPLLLTRVQAAQLLGVGPATFSSWVSAGTMPDVIPGTNRWSRIQLERAASGQAWVPSSVPIDPYEKWFEEDTKRQADRLKSFKPHSYGNLEFDPTGPLGKREIKILLALRGRTEPLKDADIHGASTATIEKLGLRGYLEKNGYFYKLLLTEKGRAASERLVKKTK